MALRQYYYEEPAYVIAGGLILPFFAIVTTALRLRIRIQQRQPLGVDDWLILPAVLFAVGIGVLMVYSVSQHGLAYPVEVPVDYEGNPLLLATPQILLTAKTQVAAILMLPAGLGCTKASIVFLYLRIFTATKRSRTYGIFIASIVVILAMTVGFFFAFLFECGSHVSAMWQSAMAAKTYCPESESYAYGFAISDFITDVMILVMPIPLIWRMKMATNTKIALTSTFIVGAGSVVSSLIRMIIYTRLWVDGISEKSDEILDITDSLYWAMISLNIATIAASLPLLYPLVKNITIASIYESARRLLSHFSLRLRDKNALQIPEHDGQSARVLECWEDRSSNTARQPASKEDYQHSLVPQTYPMNDLRAQEEAWVR